MINAALIGLGWWGKTLVEGIADSKDIRFVAGSARNHTDDIKAFSKQNNFTLYKSFEEMLKHPGLDAVVLATPHSLHVPQTIAAAQASTISAAMRGSSFMPAATGASRGRRPPRRRPWRAGRAAPGSAASRRP